MTDTTPVPEAAYIAAKAVVDMRAGKIHSDNGVVMSCLREAIEAAMPHLRAAWAADEHTRLSEHIELAEQAARERWVAALRELHKPVSSDWGQLCGYCWDRAGARQTWPCPELMAFAVAAGEHTRLSEEIEREERQSEAVSVTGGTVDVWYGDAADAFQAGLERGREERAAAERERIRHELVVRARELGYGEPELYSAAFPFLCGRLAELLDGGTDGG